MFMYKEDCLWVCYFFFFLYIYESILQFYSEFGETDGQNFCVRDFEKITLPSSLFPDLFKKKKLYK